MVDRFESFSDVTLKSLNHALAEDSCELSKEDIDKLMKAYDSLSTFPDVQPALKALKDKADTIQAVVFSNGTQSMVSSSVRSSPDLGPHSDVFAKIVTVESVKRFKPAPEVYQHLAREVGKGINAQSMSSMWLISGNPFDVVGARAAGMQAAWVDRLGMGWTDMMGQKGEEPTVIVKGLGEAVEAVEKHSQQS